MTTPSPSPTPAGTHAPAGFIQRCRLLASHIARGAGPRIVNPDFPLTTSGARAERLRMRQDPRPLARPVVVVTGWRAPTMAARGLAKRLASATSGSRSDFWPVGLPDVSSIDEAAARITSAAAKAFGHSDGATVEVDVVAVSMGGLATRLAIAKPHDTHFGPLALRARRLFTLATPHRGASLAQVLAPDAPSRAMCPGSGFLCDLDAALGRCETEIVPYARLRDAMVGARQTAPPGRAPLWIDGPRVLSHLSITLDQRIVVDVARRLRGEEPIAREGAPPPRE